MFSISRFEKDVEDMLGRKPSWFWKILLVAVSPALLLCLFIFYIVSYIQGGTPTYPAWDKNLVRPSISLVSLHSGNSVASKLIREEIREEIRVDLVPSPIAADTDVTTCVLPAGAFSGDGVSRLWPGLYRPAPGLHHQLHPAKCALYILQAQAPTRDTGRVGQIRNCFEGAGGD